MYECPNCGAGLRFDIRSGKLACGSCSSKFDPYSITKDSDAETDQEYEVTVFRCPQCGGEVYSTDNTAAGFCTFCGSSTILTSRLVKEKRPQYIIPFRRTKEDCKKEYVKMLQKAFFAPKDLKKEENINEFRGIYMPYWVYHITQGPEVSLPIYNAHRSGDYIIELHYMLNMDMDVDYKGMSYDASSSFADAVSEKLAPFDVKSMKPFTPAFLSGFYADTSDIDTTLYQEDAKKLAVHRTLGYLNEKSITEGYVVEAKNEDLLKSLLHTEIKTVEGAMFPVWFMAYRYHDRVAYATVNGQTGKIVADLPVDMKKIFGASLLMAVPIFFLLNLFLTVAPGTLLSIISVLATWVVLKYGVQMKYIAAKEGQEDDRGAIVGIRRRLSKRLSHGGPDNLEGVSDAVVAGDIPQVSDSLPGMLAKLEEKNTYSLRNIKSIIFMILLLRSSVLFAMLDEPSLKISLGSGLERLILPVTLVIVGISCFSSHAKGKFVDAKKGIEGTFWILFGMVVATAVAVFQPVSDYYYYGGVICLLAGMVVALIDLIGCYNIYATRPLPQFQHYQGGDDRA